MTKKLALLIILPSLLWFLTINNGYSQSDPNNEVENVAPLYFSYTYNMPISSEQIMMLEYWMLCEKAFENPKEHCFYLEDWMLNGAPILVYTEKDLEIWMLGDMLGTEFGDGEMKQWMLGFEPLVEVALFQSVLSADLEDWMLEFDSMAQQLFEDAFMSIKDWMFSNAFNEHETGMDIEDWMIDGISMN